jgi:hypothetical protein
VADWVNDSQAEVSSFDIAFGKIENKSYHMPKEVCVLARQMFGIGEHDGNHFALLLNGVKPSSSGDYDNHGTAEWACGIQTVVMLKLLKDCKNWYKNMLAAVKQSVHYTFKDISTVFDDYAIDFNPVTSLEGVAEKEVWWAIRRNFAYSDTNMNTPLETEVVRDPQACHSSNTLKSGLENYAGVPMWQFVFLQGMFDEDYSLVTGVEVDMKQLKYNFVLEMLMSLTSTASWQDYRYSTSMIRLVEMWYTKTSEFRTLCGIQTTTNGQSEQPRWEHLLDAQDYTNYPTVALKYMCGIVQNGIQSKIAPVSFPRPYGLYEQRTHFIHYFSDAALLRSFARGLFSTPEIKMTNDPIPPPKGENDAKSDTDEELGEE